MADMAFLKLLAKLAKNSKTGMVFVPDVVAQSGMGTHGTELELRDLQDQGLIELRPESGLGRLSREERHMCPHMRDGTPLSWVRLT